MGRFNFAAGPRGDPPARSTTVLAGSPAACFIYNLSAMASPSAITSHVRRPSFLVGLVLFATALVLYLSTVAPTLTWGWDGKAVDGGEFLAAAKTFGVPHPPGYPTYTLLLRAFATVVPVGDFAFRGNLLSAVLAATTVMVLFWAILPLCRWIKPDASANVIVTSAALGSAVFATAPLFWSQAVITEVYTLNALFVATLILVAGRSALTEPSPGMSFQKNLVLFGFILGIGLGNHLSLLAVALPLLFWMGSTSGWSRLVSPTAIAALVAGFAVYAYLPIAASQHPPINWGNTASAQGFVWQLSGRAYQDLVFGVASERINDRLLSWVELTFTQFNPLGLFLGLIGTIPLRRRLPTFFFPSLAAIAVISVYAVMMNTVDFEVLLIPAFLLFSVFVAAGFLWITTTWIVPSSQHEPDAASNGRPAVRGRYQVAVLSVLAFVLLPAVAVALNYSGQSLTGDRRAYEHAANILDSVPDGSVIMSRSEHNVFSLWYMRYVEKPQRDVAVLAVPLFRFDWYVSDIRRAFPDRVPEFPATDRAGVMRRIVEHNEGKSPIFTTFKDRPLTEPYNLDQVGKVYRIGIRERGGT